MNEQDYERLKRIVQYEARNLANDTSALVDAEDIEQEMWLHLVKRWKHFVGKDDGLVRSAVQKVGRSYCQSERYRFVIHSAQYVYTNEDVRALFGEAFFENGEWEKMPVKGDRTSIAVDNGGVVVALWDLKEAFRSLKKPEQDAIVGKYYHGDELATSTERMRVSRAVDSVVRFLNEKVVASQEAAHDYDNGPGARTVISNAHAQAITEY